MRYILNEYFILPFVIQGVQNYKKLGDLIYNGLNKYALIIAYLSIDIIQETSIFKFFAFELT